MANDYNPNIVAKNELRLLYLSIKEDGYTQPVVTIEHRACEISLPCGTILAIDAVEVPGCQMLMSQDFQIGSLAIPQGFWMEKGASAPCIVPPTNITRADIVFKSHNPSPIMVKTCVNGCGQRGAWAVSMQQMDSAPSSSGMSLGSMTSDGFLEIACPTCASSDPERKKPWISYLAVAVGGVGYGLHVNCLSSEVLAAQQERKTWRSDFKDHPPLSEPRGMSLECQPHGDPPLRIISNTKAIIVDGFHRYLVLKFHKDIQERTGGRLPIVVIKKDINHRMASTIRHNRARGKHNVAGMARIVFDMLDNGWSEERICSELGLEKDELIRLKYVTGFAKLFENVEYRQAWETRKQIQIRREYVG